MTFIFDNDCQKRLRLAKETVYWLSCGKLDWQQDNRERQGTSPNILGALGDYEKLVVSLQEDAARRLSEEDLHAVFMAQIGASSQSEWAREHGFSRAFVSELVRGTRVITPAVASALGFERRVEYIRKLPLAGE